MDKNKEIELFINRTIQNCNAIIGRLSLYNDKIGYSCYTLENGDYKIPIGTYNISLTYSPKFNTLLWELCGVPNRQGIRVHSANKKQQLKGCIALGLTRKNNTVENSRLAMQLFHSCLNGSKTYKLTIKDFTK